MSALAFDELTLRRAKHPAWQLLQHQNAPLVLGFLADVFLDPNERVLPAPVVLDALEGFLDRLHEVDPDAYPRAAQSYLDEWADPKRGWLRRTLPAGEDVFVYEPTAAVETAAAFCRGLAPREFVGTASRLLTIRELLRTIVVGSQADPSARIAALERQRADLDAQLEAIRRGEDTQMDDTTIREHYQNIQATARALLAAAVGWAPITDVQTAQDPGNPTAQECRKIFGPLLLSRADEIISMTYCSFFLMLDAATKTLPKGAALDVNTLTRQVTALQGTWGTAMNLKTFLSPTQQDGVALVRLAAYNSDCDCFRYGATRPTA